MGRSVWIYEELGSFTSAPDRPGGSLGTGLFSAYLSDSDSDTKDEKGPASVPVEDAIAWGRANALTVIVMVCDDSGGAARFSAGDVAPEKWDVRHLLQWPKDGSLLATRRLASHASSGMPADGGELSSGRWHVEVSVMESGAVLSANFVSSWAATLASDDAVIEVLSSEMTWPPPALHEPERSGFWSRLVLAGPLGSVDLLLAAETRDQAESLAVRLGVNAAQRALAEMKIPSEAGNVACRARARPQSN